MKTGVLFWVCFVLLAVAATANAQLVAGSEEDKLYQQIEEASDVNSKLELCLDFEKQFPESKVVSDIYVMLMEIYRQRNDVPKLIEFGEKAIKVEPENVSALMTVARTYGIEGRNLDRAVQYAQRAVDATARMKNEPPPPQYSDAQWQQYIASTESSAQGILGYVRSLRR